MTSNKKVILTTSFIVLLAIAVFTSVRLVNVDAHSSNSESFYKYYTSYEIKSGDTLSSIAQEYAISNDQSVDEYITEVKKNNKLISNTITSGKKIIIAYYTSEKK